MDNPEKLATQGTQDEDNPEKLTTQGTQDEDKHKESDNIGYTRRRQTQHNMCWTLYANKHKQKTCALLQATGGKDKSNTVLCGNVLLLLVGE